MAETVYYKVYLKKDAMNVEVRRFCVDGDLAWNFLYLQNKIRALFPSINDNEFKVYWQDSDKDYITIDSDEELLQSITAGMNQLQVVKLFVEVITRQLPEEGVSRQLQVHAGILCDSCRNVIVGFRYKCVTCLSFDLCGTCEGVGGHSEHFLLRIPVPLQAGCFQPQFVSKFSKYSLRLGNLAKGAGLSSNNRAVSLQVSPTTQASGMFDFSALAEFFNTMSQVPPSEQVIETDENALVSINFQAMFEEQSLNLDATTSMQAEDQSQIPEAPLMQATSEDQSLNLEATAMQATSEEQSLNIEATAMQATSEEQPLNIEATAMQATSEEQPLNIEATAMHATSEEQPLNIEATAMHATSEEQSLDLEATLMQLTSGEQPLNLENLEATSMQATSEEQPLNLEATTSRQTGIGQMVPPEPFDPNREMKVIKKLTKKIMKAIERCRHGHGERSSCRHSLFCSTHGFLRRQSSDRNEHGATGQRGVGLGTNAFGRTNHQERQLDENSAESNRRMKAIKKLTKMIMKANKRYVHGKRRICRRCLYFSNQGVPRNGSNGQRADENGSRANPQESQLDGNNPGMDLTFDVSTLTSQPEEPPVAPQQSATSSEPSGTINSSIPTTSNQNGVITSSQNYLVCYIPQTFLNQPNADLDATPLLSLMTADDWPVIRRTLPSIDLRKIALEKLIKKIVKSNKRHQHDSNGVCMCRLFCSKHSRPRQQGRDGNGQRGVGGVGSNAFGRPNRQERRQDENNAGINLRNMKAARKLTKIILKANKRYRRVHIRRFLSSGHGPNRQRAGGHGSVNFGRSNHQETQLNEDNADVDASFDVRGLASQPGETPVAPQQNETSATTNSFIPTSQQNNVAISNEDVPNVPNLNYLICYIPQTFLNQPMPDRDTTPVLAFMNADDWTVISRALPNFAKTIITMNESPAANTSDTGAPNNIQRTTVRPLAIGQPIMRSRRSRGNTVPPFY